MNYIFIDKYSQFMTIWAEVDGGKYSKFRTVFYTEKQAISEYRKIHGLKGVKFNKIYV